MRVPSVARDAAVRAPRLRIVRRSETTSTSDPPNVPAQSTTAAVSSTARPPSREEAMELDLLEDDDNDSGTDDNDTAHASPAASAIDAPRDELFMSIVLAKRPCQAATRGRSTATVWDEVATAFVAAGGVGMASGTGATKRLRYLTRLCHDEPQAVPPALRALVLQYDALSRTGNATSRPRKNVVLDELFMKTVLAIRPRHEKGSATLWHDVAEAFMAAGGNRMANAQSARNRVRSLTHVLLDQPHSLPSTLRAQILEYHELSESTDAKHTTLLETLRAIVATTAEERESIGILSTCGEDDTRGGGEEVQADAVTTGQAVRSSGSKKKARQRSFIERVDEDLVRLVMDTRPWLAGEPESWLWYAVAQELLESVDKLPDGRRVDADSVRERFTWLLDVLSDGDHLQHAWLSPAMRSMLTEYEAVPTAKLLRQLQALYRLKAKPAVGRITLVRQSLDDILLSVVLARMSRADQGMPAWWAGVARWVNARVGVTVFTTLGGSTKRRTQELLDLYQSPTQVDQLKASVRDKLRKIDGRLRLDDDAALPVPPDARGRDTETRSTKDGSGSKTGHTNRQTVDPNGDDHGQVSSANKNKIQLTGFVSNILRIRPKSKTPALASPLPTGKAFRQVGTLPSETAAPLVPATTSTKKRKASPLRAEDFVQERRTPAKRQQAGSSRPRDKPTKKGSLRVPDAVRVATGGPHVQPPPSPLLEQDTLRPLTPQEDLAAEVAKLREALALVTEKLDATIEANSRRSASDAIHTAPAVQGRTQTNDQLEQRRVERRESLVQQQVLLELLKAERERHHREIQTERELRHREIQAEREAQRRELQAERDARQRETQAMQELMDRERHAHHDEVMAMTKLMTRFHTPLAHDDVAGDEIAERAG